MMDWLADNIGTIGVSLVLAAGIVRITVKLIKDKRKGKSSCGCHCTHCAMTGKCRQNI